MDLSCLSKSIAFIIRGQKPSAQLGTDYRILPTSSVQSPGVGGPLPRITETLKALRHGSGSGGTSSDPLGIGVCRSLRKQRLNGLDGICVCKPGLLFNARTSSWSFFDISLLRKRGAACHDLTVQRGPGGDSQATVTALLAQTAGRCPRTKGRLGLPPPSQGTAPPARTCPAFPSSGLISFLPHSLPLLKKIPPQKVFSSPPNVASR